MNFEDVQAQWRSQDMHPPFSLDERALRGIVEQRRKELSRYLFWERAADYGSLLLSLLICSIFPIAMYFAPYLRTMWDILLVIGTIAPLVTWTIAIHVAYLRRKGLEPSFTSPLREAIDRDLQRIDYEISRRTSFRHLLVMNGLPLVSAVLVGVAGLRLSGDLATQLVWFAPFFILLIVGGMAWGAYLNRRALGRFYPQRRELQTLRDKLN